MARDYAKKSSSRSRHSVPGWVWMTVGLLVGLFVAFLVYLNKAQLPDDWKLSGFDVKIDTGIGKRDEPAPAEKPKEKESDQAKLNFDFYNVLPEFEVPVPEPSVIEPPKPAAPAPVPQPAQNKTAGPAQPPANSPVSIQPGSYIIQAGSFSSAEDADTRRAQLALLGIVSRIQKVTIDGGRTYHRVQVGPVDGPEGIKKISNLLEENSIEYMLVKQRG